MSFNFANTSSTFGSPANKPTAFGTPLSFGAPATTASTGFGFGSTFGAGAPQQQAAFGAGVPQQQPAFGAGAPQQQSAFGASAAQQPTAFGSSFGQPAAGATAPSFGSTFGQPASAAPAFGSTFGTPATSAPAFGSTFGAPATSTPGFGSTFGAPAASAPAFGSTFGAPAATNTFGAVAPTAAGGFGTGATAAPAFGSTFGAAAATPGLFGSPAAKTSLFGTPATTNAGLFGTPAAAASSLFGAGTTTQAPSLFGGAAATATTPSLFGTTTTTAPSLFGSAFGGPATTAAPSLFGNTGTPGFGLGATTAGTPGFSLFGSGPTTTSAPSLFGGFGKTATTASGFTGFGTGATGGFTGFGPAAATSAPTWFNSGQMSMAGSRPPGPTLASGLTQPQLLASIYSINLFNDERDNILKKWNLLQACWGTGKGYYNAAQPPMEYDTSNPLCRYKAIGYVVMPGEDNSQGIVKLIFNKKELDLSNQKEALINGILGILGNKPTLSIHINQIKALNDVQTSVMISVSEKGVTGTSRKIPAIDLANYLNQPLQKQQLNNVGVSLIAPYVPLTKAQLQDYLRTTPPGVEQQFWQTAQVDNPDPHKFMPIVLKGFGGLKQRMLSEQFETSLHRGYLDKVSTDILELKKKQANSVARIGELKQKYAQLHHRLLKIIVKQEVTRKVGMALQPEEEMLRARLEALLGQLALPSQFKAQLQEIRCSMNVNGVPDLLSNERYKMEPDSQDDIKQFLKMEQNGIAHLVKIINTDLKNLKIISDGLVKMQTSK